MDKRKIWEEKLSFSGQGPAANSLRTWSIKQHPLGLLDRSLVSARRMEFGVIGPILFRTDKL